MPDATSAEIVLLLLSETEVDRSSHYDCVLKISNSKTLKKAHRKCTKENIQMFRFGGVCSLFTWTLARV